MNNCGVCGRAFEERLGLTMHLVKAHGQEKPNHKRVQCATCGADVLVASKTLKRRPGGQSYCNLDCKADAQRHPWDTEFFSRKNADVAYWAGFALADGCLSGNRLIVSLTPGDIGHLEKLRGALQSPSPVRYIGSGPKLMVSFGVRANRLPDDLLPWGIIHRKTYADLCLPELSEELERHYLRGFFDGDGGFGSKPGGKCETYWLNVKANLSCAVYFAQVLNRNLGLSLIPRPAKVSANGWTTYVVQSGGGMQVSAILRYLYGDGGTSLERKEQRAIEIIADRERCPDRRRKSCFAGAGQTAVARQPL